MYSGWTEYICIFKTYRQNFCSLNRFEDAQIRSKSPAVLLLKDQGFGILVYPGEKLPLHDEWPNVSGECHAGMYFCGIKDVELEITEGTFHKFVPGCCRGTPGTLYNNNNINPF